MPRRALSDSHGKVSVVDRHESVEHPKATTYFGNHLDDDLVKLVVERVVHLDAEFARIVAVVGCFEVTDVGLIVSELNQLSAALLQKS